MGKYDGFLICSDIDGTLTYETGKVSKENLAAIEKFMAEGGLFTISSGRSPEFIKNLSLPFNAPVISVNGAVIYDFEKDLLLFSNPMSSHLLDLADKIKDNFSDKIDMIRFIYLDSWHLNWPENSLEFLKNRGDIYKIAVHAKNEEFALEIRDFVKENSSASVVRGWETGVEITETGISKGSGLKFLKNYFGEKVKTTIAVGNFENDVPILKAADISIAVENSPDEIKKCAKKIAPKNTEHALRFIIENLDLFGGD